MSKEAGKFSFKISTTTATLVAFALMCLAPIDVSSNAFAGIGFRFSFGGGSFGFGGGGGGGIADSLCTIVTWFTEEGIGKAIASLAVIFLGIQAFFGKVQWGTALMFAAGIFAIFGSQEIVDAITGGLSSGGC